MRAMYGSPSFIMFEIVRTLTPRRAASSCLDSYSGGAAAAGWADCPVVLSIVLMLIHGCAARCGRFVRDEKNAKKHSGEEPTVSG